LPERDRAKLGDLNEAKRRLSERLLPLDFISGVGIQGASLTVYLARALDAAEEQKVKKILDVEASGNPVEFVKTGKFSANSGCSP
jgi:hypothetical protein